MRACPICGRDEARLMFETPLALPDQFTAIPDKLRRVECGHCYMKYVDTPRTDEEMLRDYYEQPFYRSTRPYRDDDTRYAEIVGRLDAFSPSIKTVWEVGAGDGKLGEQLAQIFDYTTKTPDEPVDCVILNQVLEHVIAPRTLLERLRPKARTIYIELPNGESDQTINFEHVNAFRADDLEKLLGQAFERGKTEAQYSLWGRFLWGFWPLKKQCYVRGYGYKAFAWIRAHLDWELLGIIDLDTRDLTYKGQAVVTPDAPVVPGVTVVVCIDDWQIAKKVAEEYPDNPVLIV